MKIYHGSVDTDAHAEQAAVKLAEQLTSGEVYVSRSFGEGPAIIVVKAPDEVNPSEFAEGIEFKEYVLETEVTQGADVNRSDRSEKGVE